MKTLPVSDLPQVLVLYSEDLVRVALQAKKEGFEPIYEQLGESNRQGGLLLSSANLDPNHQVSLGWYKVVLFVSAFYILSEKLLEQLNNLKCPLLIIIPVFTYDFQNLTTDKEINKDINQLTQAQSVLLNQVATQLPSSCLQLVDGLVMGRDLISSNASLFQLAMSLAKESVNLPTSISLIGHIQLIDQVLNQITTPRLGAGSILASKPIDARQFYQKSSRFLEQAYQLKVASANFVELATQDLPLVKSTVLSNQEATLSDFIGSTRSPDQQRENLYGQVALINNRLQTWRESRVRRVETKHLVENEIKQELTTSLRSSFGDHLVSKQKLEDRTVDSNPAVLIKNTNKSYAKSTGSPTENIKQVAVRAKAPGFNIKPTSLDGESLPVSANAATFKPTSISTPTQTTLHDSPPTFASSFASSPTFAPNSSPPTYPNQELDSQLTSIFTKKRLVEKSSHQSKIKHIKNRIQAKSKRRRGLFVGGVALTVVSLAALFFVGFYSLLSNFLNQQVGFLVKNLRSDYVSKPSWVLDVATNLVDWQNKFYDLLFDETVTQQPSNSVKLARTIAKLSLMNQNKTPIIQEVFSHLLVSNQLDLLNVEKAIALRSAWFDMWQELVVLSEAENLDLSSDLEKDLSNIKQEQAILLSLSPHLTEILGFHQPKTYAIVFQNTQELRSTGGFIQSMGLITLDRGQIINGQAYSSYEIDKLLGGAVDPSPDLIKYLGEKQLYFRDSNWDPNFPDSAGTMLWFIEKGLNKKIDGVFALTTASLQDLISIIGQLGLASDNQTVSAQNLLDRLESNSSVQGLTPNEPQEYSAQIMTSLLNQLTKLTPEQTRQLLIAIKSGLQNANLIVFFKDSSIQQVVADLGWSGSVLTPPCPSPFNQKDCRIDPFYLVENNVGINKANQYLQRKNQTSIKIDKSGIKYHFQISYENKTDVSSWPKGSYLAYARAFLPPNASNVKIMIEGVEINSKDFTISSWEDRSVIGFKFEVPIKSKKKLEIEFETPSLTNQESYVFFMQKQPGVSLEPVQVVVELPEEQIPKQVSPGSTISNNQVVFSPTPNPHLLVGLSF